MQNVKCKTIPARRDKIQKDRNKWQAMGGSVQAQNRATSVFAALPVLPVPRHGGRRNGSEWLLWTGTEWKFPGNKTNSFV
jgi:hypothetical protein